MAVLKNNDYCVYQIRITILLISRHLGNNQTECMEKLTDVVPKAQYSMTGCPIHLSLQGMQY